MERDRRRRRRSGAPASLASFCLVDDGGGVLGITRVVGDGAVYLYVQDVIVSASAGAGMDVH